MNDNVLRDVNGMLNTLSKILGVDFKVETPHYTFEQLYCTTYPSKMCSNGRLKLSDKHGKHFKGAFEETLFLELPVQEYFIDESRPLNGYVDQIKGEENPILYILAGDELLYEVEIDKPGYRIVQLYFNEKNILIDSVLPTCFWDPKPTRYYVDVYKDD